MIKNVKNIKIESKSLDLIRTILARKIVKMGNIRMKIRSKMVKIGKYKNEN